MNRTKIEWAEVTWNPVTGCTPVSEGCQNCYAKRMATRLRGRCGYPENDPFRVTLHPERLKEPLRWKKPRRVFVCSMGDLFHPDVPVEFIDRVFAIMALATQHTFIILTKRPLRMKEYIKYRAARNFYHLKHIEWPLPCVWLGVSCENQRAADERIPILLQTPAAVRFVSVEPMLGPVDLETQLGNAEESRHCLNGWHGIDWVICGGETGPRARPMHPAWVRSLQNQCQAAGVPFFFKSWGEYCYPDQLPDETYELLEPECFVGGFPLHIGKKKAGRYLDGRTWDEFPEG